MTNFKFIDLFSGIGGFRLAAEKHGGVSVGFSEIDKDAIRYYCENFNDTPDNNFGDITKIVSLPEHDLMMAGVPCQSWSIAGKQLGFDDNRGKLWNDTLYLLQKSRPKAFIFENVKGLSDPRNNEAFSYILDRIRQSGYHCKHFIINSNDYGVPQNRVRVYIIGFRDKVFCDRFAIPGPSPSSQTLGGVLFGYSESEMRRIEGFSGYFHVNDLRDGVSTIHSWDIYGTDDREKSICRALMKNRRKKKYGNLDGNPLGVSDLSEFIGDIREEELENLVRKGILVRRCMRYLICGDMSNANDAESSVLSSNIDGILYIDRIKNDKSLKINKINIYKTIDSLELKGIIKKMEVKYDFKNTKISSGIDGVNRIYTPYATSYSTLVASDSNDFISTDKLQSNTLDALKEEFIQRILNRKSYRKATKREACIIQGFPDDFFLPESRSRWMHLIGNSVSVKVVDMLVGCIVSTGVFD